MAARMSRAPFVRLYNPKTDFEDTIHVFRETCDDSLKVEPIWTIGSYIWCRPYLFLVPNTCFVLDDGQGKAVGYIIGAINSKHFCSKWNTEYLPTVKDDLESLPPPNGKDESETLLLKRRKQTLLDLIRSNPEKLVYDQRDLLADRGHLHIDLLPAYHRQGYGKQLIQQFIDATRAQGCTGLYLGMVASNLGAAAFYEACGFHRLPVVLDDGVSGELGRTKKDADGGEQLYYVLDM